MKNFPTFVSLNHEISIMIKSVNPMKKSCLSFLLLLFSCFSVLADERLDSLLNVLDATIKEADAYVQIKENRLRELKRETGKTPPVSIERYNLNNRI